MNTFLARTGSNSTCFLAIKQSLPCGCEQFRGSVRRLRLPLDPPLNVMTSMFRVYKCACVIKFHVARPLMKMASNSRLYLCSH